MSNYTPPREFTADEDALVKAWVDGLVPCKRVAEAIGCSPPTVRFRARRLGLTQAKLPTPATFERGEMVGHGSAWVPIAHNDRGKWKPLDGAPVTRAEAADMVAAGIATTAQKKIDGGWDLMFKVLK